MVCLGLVACHSESYEARLHVFGTWVTIQLQGIDTDQAESLITAINSDFQQLHHDWHAWQPGQLDQLNRALAQGLSYPISPQLADLLRRATQLEAHSQGTFNAAIGNLIRAWGFHTSDYPVTQAPPDVEQIEQLLRPQPSLQDLVLSEDRARSENPAVRIDLGGIAKGAALARAHTMIAPLAPDRMLINAGGDLLAWSHSKPWRIAIRDPSNPRAALGIVQTHGLTAIFSSGNYTRNRDEDQKRGHIIDPRTGQPIEHTLSATVIASDPVLADAAATALVVAGPLRWRQVASTMGIEQALVVAADGCLEVTPALLKIIEWTDPPSCLDDSP